MSKSTNVIQTQIRFRLLPTFYHKYDKIAQLLMNQIIVALHGVKVVNFLSQKQVIYILCVIYVHSTTLLSTTVYKNCC